MTQFHHHPDGVIYFRGEAGVYQAGLAQFKADLGQLGLEVYPDLPPGMIERRIDAKGHLLFSADSQFEADDWPNGIHIVTCYPRLLALQEARLTKPSGQADQDEP